MGSEELKYSSQRVTFCLSVTYHYEMDCPLPCSTLAVAVGWWHCRQSRNAETKNGSNPNLPVTCRLFAPPSLIDTAANELLGYAPKFLEASCELLGPYPFRRLNMLVLPKCFACMGLKRLVYRSKYKFSIVKLYMCLNGGYENLHESFSHG